MNYKYLVYSFIAILIIVSCKKEASNINYGQTEFFILQEEGIVSSVATVEGTPPFVFSISRINSAGDAYSRDDPNSISINSSNGAIELANKNILVPSTYTIDVQVENEKGKTIFPAALAIHIGILPDQLSFSNNNVIIAEGEDYITEQPGYTGSSPVKFNLEEETNYSGFISVEEEMGIISVDGSKSIKGSYEVYLLVTNDFGSARIKAIDLTIQ